MPPPQPPPESSLLESYCIFCAIVCYNLLSDFTVGVSQKRLRFGTFEQYGGSKTMGPFKVRLNNMINMGTKEGNGFGI